MGREPLIIVEPGVTTPMPYDPSKLKTAEDCKNLMENARQRGRWDIYDIAFTRKCEIEGDKHNDPRDPLIRDFYVMLAALQIVLTEKNGRTTIPQRTINKAKAEGVLKTVQDWARKRTPTEGFTLLVNAGHWKMTGEYLVLKHSHRFDPEYVAAARKRLQEAGFPVLDVEG